MARTFWSEEAALGEARKYATRAELWAHARGAQNFLKRKGLIDVACEHMVPVHNDYTQEWVMQEAKKYTKRSDFIAGFAGGVAHAKRHGYYNDACAHMDVKRKKWSRDTVMAESIKYETRGEFALGCVAAYTYAHARGWLDDVCSHMPSNLCAKWDRDSVLAETKKYKTRSEFIDACGGAYSHARRNGLVGDLFAKMPPSWSGFSGQKPAVLYCMEITLPDGEVLCKIGITNRTANLRKHGLGLGDGVGAKVIHEVRFSRGEQARNAERQFHRDFAHLKYQGPPIMSNGNTELFGRDVINAFISNKGDQR